MIKFTENDGGIIFDVRVVPRASKSEIVGESGGALKVRISSPPVDGAANAELLKLLSKKLRVSKNNIKIVSGETSRSKKVKIYGLNKISLISFLSKT